jgi:hypothetical protein
MAYKMNGGKEPGSSYKNNQIGSAFQQKGLTNDPIKVTKKANKIQKRAFKQMDKSDEFITKSTRGSFGFDKATEKTLIARRQSGPPSYNYNNETRIDKLDRQLNRFEQTAKNKANKFIQAKADKKVAKVKLRSEYKKAKKDWGGVR